MKPWKTWLVRLGVAGALVIVAGCGSSDVPDPSSDSAAGELPTGGDAAAPVAAPAAPAASDTVAQLKEMAELHSQGILTDDEFAAQKAKILGTA